MVIVYFCKLFHRQGLFFFFKHGFIFFVRWINLTPYNCSIFPTHSTILGFQKINSQCNIRSYRKLKSVSFSDPGFGGTFETAAAGHCHGDCLLQTVLCQVRMQSYILCTSIILILHKMCSFYKMLSPANSFEWKR